MSMAICPIVDLPICEKLSRSSTSVPADCADSTMVSRNLFSESFSLSPAEAQSSSE
jgi:hypothetical protein